LYLVSKTFYIKKRIQEHQARFSENTNPSSFRVVNSKTEKRTNDSKINNESLLLDEESKRESSNNENNKVKVDMINLKSSSLKNIPKYIDQTLNEDEDDDGNSSSTMNLEKEKVKEIIEQKSKHEKRLHLLEQLVEMEKEHTERLRKILIDDSNKELSEEIHQILDLSNPFIKIKNNNINKSMQKEEKCIQVINIYDERKRNRDEIKEICYEIKKTRQKPKPPVTWFYPLADEASQNDYQKQIEGENCLKNSTSSICSCCHEDMSKPPGLYDCWCRINKNMNLQEAFQLYKYDFISRSRQRQREIKINETRRKVESDLKTKTYLTLRNRLEAKLIHQQQQQKSTKKSNSEYFLIDALSSSNNKIHQHQDHHHHHNHHVSDRLRKCRINNHQINSDQIREQTKKKYQKLPEVKQKQIKKQLEENKKRNRIKYNIYKKV
jgi:hypothetical protein